MVSRRVATIEILIQPSLRDAMPLAAINPALKDRAKFILPLTRLKMRGNQ